MTYQLTSLSVESPSVPGHRVGATQVLTDQKDKKLWRLALGDNTHIFLPATLSFERVADAGERMLLSHQRKRDTERAAGDSFNLDIEDIKREFS